MVVADQDRCELFELNIYDAVDAPFFRLYWQGNFVMPPNMSLCNRQLFYLETRLELVALISDFISDDPLGLQRTWVSALRKFTTIPTRIFSKIPPH